MWLSTRAIRSTDDDEWAGHLDYLGLLQTCEVRSIDSWCNPHVDYSQNFRLNLLDEVWEMLDWVPIPVGRQYYLLFLDANKKQTLPKHLRLKLLGYDLSNQAGRSSLFNYQRWTGVLAPFLQRVNQFGLLNWEDAKAAQAILPEAWCYKPQSSVTIWALFEVLPFDDQHEYFQARPKAKVGTR
ncbi:hypothetical protein JYQ62_04535 [Nostoc sp. UHCC 0702]|nr:hypothetical protein JYQ62_04535 [Nostoc sp. UHCC 0702]